MELNLRRDFQFAGGKYSPLRTEAKSAALRKIRAADRTPEEMMGAWNQYLDNLYREQSKLYADIQNARTLGLSDRDIRRQLIGEAKLGTDEVNRIMRGEFYAGYPAAGAERGDQPCHPVLRNPLRRFPEGVSRSCSRTAAVGSSPRGGRNGNDPRRTSGKTCPSTHRGV
jgi:hypothetical protein